MDRIRIRGGRGLRGTVRVSGSKNGALPILAASLLVDGPIRLRNMPRLTDVENLLRILETRLDNVVFRLGFADSRNQARQLVRHGHFHLNGRRTDIPSALVKANDVIEVAPGSKESEYFKIAQAGMAKRTVPRWLDLDLAGMRGRVLAVPGREDIDLEGLDEVDAHDFRALEAVNPEEFKKEILSQEELFLKMAGNLPKEMIFQREMLISRL